MSRVNEGGMHLIYGVHAIGQKRESSHKKEETERKDRIGNRYRELNKLDRPLLVRFDNSCRIEEVGISEKIDTICYYNGHLHNGKKRKLYIWVAFDKGGIKHCTHGEEPSGYYLYLMYHLNKIDYDIGFPSCRKVLLFESDKKTVKGETKAVRMAKWFSRSIVTNYIPYLDVDWSTAIHPELIDIPYFLCGSPSVCARDFRSIKNCQFSFDS